MLWATRIMAVALLMVLPGVLGRWLDDRFGTQWLVLLGFAIGLVAGMVQLLVMTGAFSPTTTVTRSGKPPSTKSGGKRREHAGERRYRSGEASEGGDSAGEGSSTEGDAPESGSSK